jgi:hypothetical protein
MLAEEKHADSLQLLYPGQSNVLQMYLTLVC